MTDSAAALPPHWLAQRPGHLRVVGMPVIIDEEIYSPGELDDSAQQISENLALALAMGKSVRTSRPSPAAFAKVYAELAAAGYAEILSVHLSGKLSGTVDAARLAARDAELPVQVLDSATAAMCLGFAVMDACTTAAQGHGSARVAEATQASIDSSSVLFYVPSLEQLRRGGRIGAASSWLGTILAIKPLLGIAEGRVAPVEKVRTAARALARLEELSLQSVSSLPGVQTRFAVHHFGAPAQAAALGERLRQQCPQAQEILISEVPAVLAAHVGLGVLAIVVSQAPELKD